MKTKKSILMIFVFIFSCSFTFAAEGIISLLEWNFYNTSVTGKEATSNACLNDIDLKQSVLSRGLGAPGNSGFSNGFVGTIQPSSSKEEAINQQVYFEFKVQPQVGNTANLSELTVQLRSQNACMYQWMYSRNQNQFADLSQVVSMDSTGIGVFQDPINLSTFSDLQQITSNDSVTIRLYVWGGVKSQGFGFGKSGGSTTSGYIPSIVVKGSMVRNTHVIAGWGLQEYTGVTEGSLNASTVDNNLKYAILGRGAGFTAASLNFSYVSSSQLLGANKDEAINNNEYFEIKLNAKDTYKLSLISLNYKYRRNSSGPSGYKWKYSLNGVDFTDVGATETDEAVFSSDGVSYAIDLNSIVALQNIPVQTIVTLRMYVWGSGSSSQVFGFGRYYAGSVAVPNVMTVYVKGEVKSINSGISSQFSSANEAIYIYKSANNQYIVENKSLNQQPVTATISDISGRVLYSTSLEMSNGENYLSVPTGLNTGIYIVCLKGNNGFSYNQKINL